MDRPTAAMPLPRLSLDDLHDVVPRLPAEMQADPAGRVIGVHSSVIAHFFGPDWFAAHYRFPLIRPIDESRNARRCAWRIGCTAYQRWELFRRSILVIL